MFYHFLINFAYLKLFFAQIPRRSKIIIGQKITKKNFLQSVKNFLTLGAFTTQKKKTVKSANKASEHKCELDDEARHHQ